MDQVKIQFMARPLLGAQIHLCHDKAIASISFSTLGKRERTMTLGGL
jgi:hypothetical protein